MKRFAIRVRRDAAEVALAQLLDFAPGGVEEVDVDADTVEYAIYAAPEDQPTPQQLKAALGDALVALIGTSVADDWADRWREFHRPLVLGERLAVRPPWEPPLGTALEIVIDPGRAFGTGAHATTRLCLEALLELSPPPAAPPTIDATASTTSPPPPVAIDLGCGSGVLAIAAAKLGWDRVLGLDYDPLSVEATQANAEVNGVASQLEVQQFDLNEQPPPAAPLVLANLLAPLLATWAAHMRNGAPRPDVIVASGLLATEAENVAGLYTELGFRLLQRLQHAEWAALVLSQRES